jgi:hypothetical protein
VTQLLSTYLVRRVEIEVPCRLDLFPKDSKP